MKDLRHGLVHILPSLILHAVHVLLRLFFGRDCTYDTRYASLFQQCTLATDGILVIIGFGRHAGSYDIHTQLSARTFVSQFHLTDKVVMAISCSNGFDIPIFLFFFSFSYLLNFVHSLISISPFLFSYIPNAPSKNGSSVVDTLSYFLPLQLKFLSPLFDSPRR